MDHPIISFLIHWVTRADVTDSEEERIWANYVNVDVVETLGPKVTVAGRDYIAGLVDEGDVFTTEFFPEDANGGTEAGDGAGQA